MLDRSFADFHGLFIGQIEVVYCRKDYKNQPLDYSKGGAGYEYTSVLFRVSAVYIKLRLMKRVAAIPLLLLVLILFFGLGGFLLLQAIDILFAGELTYARKRHPSVTVSPGSHGFSYYYQVSYFAAFGGYLVLMGISFLLYAAAWLLRATGGSDSQGGSIAYSVATRLAIFAFGVFVIWFVLHCLRYWVVA